VHVSRDLLGSGSRQVCRSGSRAGRWPDGLLAALLCAIGLAALRCGEEASDGPEPLFPADYAASYTEVRSCRSSTEHELNNIRVLADDAALAAYRDRQADFPEGSVVLKEEYGFADSTCSGEVVRWTLMARLASGSSPQTLDWYWQDMDGERRVLSENDSRCIGCHQGCGNPPEGYRGTCTVVGATDGAFP
jgi:hypothetical protein